MTTQGADLFIHTKLRLPFGRAALVPRPRLREQVAQGLCGPLTLVTAPAGFGKTTLVASCVENCGMPVAWLSLDKDDNLKGRFLKYFIAALQQADNRIANEAAQLLAAPEQAPTEVILTTLINDLDTAGRDLALVLDDYQLISNQAVHEAVGFLLEHIPNTFHLVIATRSDPPLPLSRLRARAQTVELRAADLRFTLPEVAGFLNDVMGLQLDAGSIGMLEERTEGWIAGLQMAALSMRDREDRLAFIEGFSGTQRHILDYLLEEVLTTQPPEVQQFLLCTSILERLSAPLCDALLADCKIGILAGANPSTDPPFTQSASQIMLEYLEKANLFLVPLDDERIWYRYHHLFADLLRARLHQIHPGLLPRLHARAAAWLENAEMTVDAINHNLSAGEYDHAARLVEENTTRLLAQGELNALMGWIEMLPAELRPSRPWLCIHQAYALTFAGRSAEVEPLLVQAEAALVPAPEPVGPPPSSQADKLDATSVDGAETRRLKGAIAAVRAISAAIMVNDAEALCQARQAQELLETGDWFNRSLVAWALGYSRHNQGHLAEARSAFEEQIRLSRAMRNNATLMIGLTALARVLADQGHLYEARALLQSALVEAGQKGTRNMGFIVRLKAHLAGVLCEQNELEAAHDLLSDALIHSRFWLNANHLAFIYIHLARVMIAEGDLEGARIVIEKVDRLRRNTPLSDWLRHSAEAGIVRVWLTLKSAGRVRAPTDPLAVQSSLIVGSWRSELPAYTEDSAVGMDQYTEMSFLTLARVALASGLTAEALTLLKPVTRASKRAGHVGAAIESLVLTAMASWGKTMEQANTALTALEEALCLGESGGYMQIFLQEGRPMQMLLAQWQGLANDGPLRKYAASLLAHLDTGPQAVKAAQAQDASAAGLVDPLSAREVEVLHLMALGMMNQEIAVQLIIAPGTVKAHTASIYRKLEVTNRTQAVARARQLGILP